MSHSLTIKRLAAPTTWAMKRKGITFVTRPLPGAHPYRLGTPLGFMLRDVLGVARTAKEALYILNNKDVLVNGVKRKDKKFIIGFMDSLSLASVNQHYRIILSKNGTLDVAGIDADDAKKKIAKIIGKTSTKGNRLQLNLSDGMNILVEKDEYKPGDSLLFEVPENKISIHFRLEKGAFVMLTDGKHCGKSGVVEDITNDIIVFKANDEVCRTKKAFAFVLGKDASALKIT